MAMNGKKRAMIYGPKTDRILARNYVEGGGAKKQRQIGARQASWIECVEDFYDRMDDVMSPSPLDPTRAMKEAIEDIGRVAEDQEHAARYVASGTRFECFGNMSGSILFCS
jgi:hypothetical protein